MNLETMNTKQLRAFRDRIDNLIAEKQKAARRELKDKFQAMAAEVDLSLDDVVQWRGKGTSKGKMTAVTAKWRDARTGVLWGGRGRYPRGFDKKRAVVI